MNAAERYAEETERQEATEQYERERRTAEDAAATRQATPQTRYRTTITEPPPERTVTVVPPQVSPVETRIWWEWTRTEIASAVAAVKADHEAAMERLRDGCGEALGTLMARTRDRLKEDDARILDRVEILQHELKLARDQLDRERIENARIADIERAERDRELEGLRREIAGLRGELGIDRGLRALQDQIAIAKSEIPQVPAIEERLGAAQRRLEREQGRLERELAKAANRIADLRVGQGLVEHGLKELEQQNKSAGATIEIEQNVARLTLPELTEQAQAALRQFSLSVLQNGTDIPIWNGTKQ